MRPLVARVGRLHRLAVFDAAARRGSFTAAAAELGMTQPAVTRQVRALERAIGVELFERTANRISLSEAGRRLAADLELVFGELEASLESIGPDEHTARPFVIASPPGFAQALMLPRLHELHEALVVDDVRLWLYDRDDDLADGGYDVAIRLAAGEIPGDEHHDLFRERVLPVATSSLADRHGLTADSTASEVAAAPLLHMESDGRPWMSWTDWLAEFGLAVAADRRRVTINNYPSVTQQALAGHGVALGWLGLVDDLLDSGVLVAVGPTVTTPRTYRISWPSGQRTPSVDAVIAWLDPPT